MSCPPFDPADVWGPRDRYHVTGTVNGARFRGALLSRDRAWVIQRGPKSPGAALLADGDAVTVEIWPEGPQIGELAADIVQALEARPNAKLAFEGLAQFYWRGWLRWIDATKRRPEARRERVGSASPRWCDSSRLATRSGHSGRPGQPSGIRILLGVAFAEELGNQHDRRRETESPYG